MEDLYRKKLGIAESAIVKKTDDAREMKKGEDTDIYRYDVFDSSGTLTKKIEIRESTSMYPPFSNSVTFKEYSPSGALVKSGALTGLNSI